MKRRVLRTSGELASTAAVAALLVGAVAPFARREVLTIDIGGTDLELLAPVTLFAVGLVPFLIWGALRSLADLPSLQKWLLTAVRIGLVGSLVLALARTSVVTDRSDVSAVVLVDVSDSIEDAALDHARDLVARIEAIRGDHDVKIVTFARDARVEPPERDANARPALSRHLDPTGASAGSRIESALHLAYGLFTPGHLRRALFVTDGKQTEGDLLTEAGRASELGVKLFFDPYRFRTPPEVAAQAIEIPPAIEVGAPFTVRARVHATTPTSAKVRLYQGDVLNGLDSVREVSLVEGETELEFRSIVRVAGPVTYRLEVEPSGPDRFAENNRFETTVVVPGRPSILYVEGTEGRALGLTAALGAGDFELDVRGPRGLPTTIGELERFDFVVLSNVPSDHVSLTQMDAIERYVRDLGGGFLMAGGDRGFGLGGYQGTRLERLLPVRMDAERRRDQPTVALALVIDKSGSMVGTPIELAKEAARASAELLGPDDYVSVIGFDSRPERIVRMQSARNRLSIVRDLGRMAARGGTAIFPALDMAYQDLAVTRAKIRHAIVLTDGISPDDGIEELVTLMRAENMSLTVVGLGNEVNRPLLERIARTGNGRAHFTNDPQNIPRIFVKETLTVARSAAVEEYVRPLLTAPADFLRGIDVQRAPFLHGYVATRKKPLPAQVVFESELGEPLLARWRVGLGWSIAWTSDVTNRWSSEWMRWPSASRFWTQLVREHMRQKRRRLLAMEATAIDDEVHVVVDAIDREDRFLNDLESRVTLVGPMGAPPEGRRREEAPLRQTAPGRYEARLPLSGFGSFVVEAVHTRDGRAIAESVAHLSRPYPREYVAGASDPDLLERAARRTGGAALESIETLFAPGADVIRTHRRLWPAMVGIALALFLLDLLLRRVRLARRPSTSERRVRP